MLSRVSSSSSCPILKSSTSLTCLSTSSTASTSTSSLLFSSKRSTIFSSYCSKHLEEAATKNSYQAPYWVDASHVQRYLWRKNIVPRDKEVPTTVSIQQHIALYNLDQLGCFAKGAEFISKLPRGVTQPTDATTLQPARGAEHQHLTSIAHNNKWGPWWLQAKDIKSNGLTPPKDRSLAPVAWKDVTHSVGLFNLDQLKTGSDVDISTIPINYRYSMFMIGTDLSEQIRNEAMRRDIKYPVVTTSKMIELVGCSIRAECIDGFVVDKSTLPQYENKNNANNNKYYSNYNSSYYNILFNLDEFNVGSDVIVKAMNLSPHPELKTDTPTFAKTGHPIMRQLILRDGTQDKKQQQDENAAPGEDKNDKTKETNETNTKTSSSSAASSSDNILKKFKTNYWIREYEARQFSDGAWKLKPDAVGAELGESLYELRKQQEMKDRANADGSGDVTENVSVTAGNQNYNNNNGNTFYKAPLVTLTPYYFDTDVKQRKEFLTAIGSYVL